MKILLIGYGKMGKTIEKIALERGHEVPYKIDKGDHGVLAGLSGADVDVAIEFTEPSAAFENISMALDKKIPVVSGTTGWLEKKPEIEKICKERGAGFFYASTIALG